MDKQVGRGWHLCRNVPLTPPFDLYGHVVLSRAWEEAAEAGIGEAENDEEKEEGEEEGGGKVGGKRGEGGKREGGVFWGRQDG